MVESPTELAIGDRAPKSHIAPHKAKAAELAKAFTAVSEYAGPGLIVEMVAVGSVFLGIWVVFLIHEAGKNAEVNDYTVVKI